MKDDQMLLLEQIDSGVQSLPIAGGNVALYSRRSPAKDTPNEDGALVMPLGPDAGVIAIADGCGGMAEGEVAARIALQTLAETLRPPDAEGGLRPLILDAIELANRRIRELASGAATTLAVVELERGYMRPYHVGDSEILLTGNFGKIKCQTTSHSPVGYALESGMLDERDAIHHEDRHLVSNIVGSADMRIEIGARRRLADRDTLLVSSDGLTDNLHTEEIVAFVRKGPQRRSLQTLVEAAIARMADEGSAKPSKPDDLSVLMFRPGGR